MPDMSALRKNMVQHQIAARGVSDERLLDAMKVVPRAAFMPDALGEFACEGHAAAESRTGRRSRSPASSPS
jgi:protein-L-isoaspartate(D-aspartate) O-methyltransferase